MDAVIHLNQDGSLTVASGGHVAPEAAFRLALDLLAVRAGYPTSADCGEEDVLGAVLADNPFPEDRLDALLNCILREFDPLEVLPDERAAQIGRDLLDVLDRAVHWFPKGEN